MAKFEVSVVIDRPAEEVWRTLCDPSSFQKLDRYCLEAKQTSPGPIGVGTTFQLKRSRTPKEPNFLVTEYDPAAQKTTLEFTSGPVKGTKQQFTVETVEGKTRLIRTFDLKYVGLYKLLGPFMTGSVKREAAADLDHTKHMLESGSAS